jgi:UMF1 family MFS transporter
MFQKLRFEKKVWGWVLYDWANSTFSTTVMAGFFPLFFKMYFSQGVDPTVSTAQLGFGNAIGTFFVALTAPFLGVLSDQGGFKKLFLGIFCIIGAFFTVGLGFIQEGAWFIAICFYVLASLAHASSFAFYDSLLTEVSDEENVHFISALGYSVGYLGGGLLFLINILMFQFPHMFGISNEVWAIKISFISVGVWWVLFTLPLFLWVNETKKNTHLKRMNLMELFRSGLKELSVTVKELRHLKMIVLFLAGFFLYNDGVGTTIRMAVDYGISIGFQDKDLISALLLVQFVGFPSALLLGKIAQNFNPKGVLLSAIFTYIVIVVWAYKMEALYEFYILAVLIGVVQGGVQSISRSYYTKLIPKEKSGEFFGFYNILGRFAGMFGPVLMGVTGLVTNNPRLGILSVAVLFVFGGLLLYFVDEKRSQKEIQILRG